MRAPHDGSLGVLRTTAALRNALSVVRPRVRLSVRALRVRVHLVQRRRARWLSGHNFVLAAVSLYAFHSWRPNAIALSPLPPLAVVLVIRVLLHLADRRRNGEGAATD